MLRAMLYIAGALFVHGGLVHTLSLVGRRYKKDGRVLHSIIFHPYHFVGVSLALAAGVLLSVPVPAGFIAAQVTVAVALFFADELMTFRAIRAVERQ